MRTIKVFLASSIEEFENERYELTSVFESLNREGVKAGFQIDVETCERSSRALAKERKQNEYNQMIRGSDYFFMIIGKKLGCYTIEEFEVALEQFQKSGAPKIYTYFKKLPEGHYPDRSVTDFKERLERRVGHFPDTFSDLDTIRADFFYDLMQRELFAGPGAADGRASREVPYEEKEDLVNLMFGLFQKSSDFQDPAKLQREVLKIHRSLAREKPAVYESDVAETSHRLALLLEKMNQRKEAEEMYREALQIYRRLAEENPEKYGPDEALAKNNLAVLLSKMGQKEEAETLCREAWEIYRRMAAENPKCYEADAARIAGNLKSLGALGEPDCNHK